VQLPPNLAHAIATEAERVGTKELGQAASELSDAYRARRPIGKNYIVSDAHRLAYATTRMPATYAAVRSVLGQVSPILSDAQPASLLDLGAGPGTASWAALDTFSSLTAFTLVEQDPGLIQMGQTLAQTANLETLSSADWQCRDLKTRDPFPESDLVICSYAVGELDTGSFPNLVKEAWKAAKRALVIVEPGTGPGFTRIRAIRDQLIGLDAHIAAPCPHAADCPMSDDDWCHFAQRLDRSSLHRQLKSGSMGHEDEKFSYIAVTREPVAKLPSRVLRHPQRRSGHAHLSLCTEDGLQQVTVTRSAKADWKRVRKLSWGDAW
jgi:ribosomal protein RSM22 (predicted rRNA methylase)